MQLPKTNIKLRKKINTTSSFYTIYIIWFANSVCGRFGLWPFRFVTVPSCGHFGLWPFWFEAVSVCGRSGLWPFRFVAVSVCGRFGFGRFGLWPSWPETHHTTVCWYSSFWRHFDLVKQFKFGVSGIIFRTHGRNGLKFDMLMYPDHHWNWLHSDHGLLVFLILAPFDLVKQVTCAAFRHFRDNVWE